MQTVIDTINKNGVNYLYFIIINSFFTNAPINLHFDQSIIFELQGVPISDKCVHIHIFRIFNSIFS